jgi:O-antigen/teichoic acid export membrane protein
MKHTSTFTQLLHMSLAQGMSYVVPWLTIPFLIRRLGVEEFGWVALANGVALFLSFIVECSFGTSAPREVARRRHVPSELVTYVTRVLWTRCSLLFVAWTLLLLLLALVPAFQSRWWLFVLAAVSLIGHALSPVYFFQGLDCFTTSARLSFAVRVIPAVTIFLLVDSPDDAVLVVLLQSFLFVLISFGGLLYFFRISGCHLGASTFREIQGELRSGLPLFLSNISVAVYTATGTLLLGLFSTIEHVGYFRAGEKTVRVVLGGLHLIFQLFYPRIALLPQKDVMLYHPLVRQPLKIALPLAIASTTVFLMFPEMISQLLVGEAAHELVWVLRTVGALPIIVTFSYLVNDTLHLSLNLDVRRMGILLSAAVIFLVSSSISLGVFHSGFKGLALNMLLVEVYILAASFLSIRLYSLRSGVAA